MQPDEAAVYDFCMELAKDHVVSDTKFKKARELFSDQQNRRSDHGQRRLHHLSYVEQYG